MTLLDVVTDAYIENRRIAPGEDPDAELGAFALGRANLVLEDFNITSVLIYTTNILVFPMTIRTLPDYWYTIGPSGADFTAPRPTAISRANVILNNTTPTVRIPIEILNDDQWSDVTIPDLFSAPYPTKLYNNGDFPNSRLYLWPAPNQAGNSLELFVPNQTAAFASLSDTFTGPPGFTNAFMLTLAESTISAFDDCPPQLTMKAAKARNAYGRINRVLPKMSTTDGTVGSGGDGPGNNFWSGWMQR